jgi:DNA-binding NarL/FixJ family response regulator
VEKSSCPLSRSLLRLVCCAAQRGTCTKKLTQVLRLSNQSINTYWKRIKKILNIEERHQAVALAQANGWFDLLPPEQRVWE